MSWKTTLYNYVHSRNQTDIDYSIEPMLPFVGDASFLETQAKRLQRLKQSDWMRGLTPVKHETRLSVSSVSEQRGSIIADIKLMRTIVGEIRHTPHEEQRIEKERITLTADEGDYRIESVELLDHEDTLRDRKRHV